MVVGNQAVGCVLALCLVLVLGACVDLGVSPNDPFAASREDGAFDTHIPLERQHFDLTDDAESGIIQPQFVNQSEIELFYQAPSLYLVRLEKWTGGEWEDRGSWYSIIPIPRVRTLAPGDTLRAPTLNLRHVSERVIDGPGYYRLVFAVYSDYESPELIPEVDRASDPFEVIP